MAVILRRASRLRFGDLLEIDGTECWDVLQLPTIPVQSDDINYRVTGNDRIDLLADRFYGDPIFWWVIAYANDMEILPTDLVEGALIRIPSPRYVSRELFGKAKVGS